MSSWWLVALVVLSALAAPAPTRATSQPDLMALPPPLQAELEAQVLAGNPAQRERMQRLVEFVLKPQGLGMRYRSDATHGVAQAYATREANCLGFTLLFVALARAAGLDAYPQDAGETLIWHELGGTIYRSDHVNAGVVVGGASYTLDVAGDVVLATHAPVRMSDAQLLARYRNNLAVAAFQEGRIADARREMDIALSLDPGSTRIWSNAGVLYLRDGDAAAAEHAYAHALSLDPENTNALTNMMNLAHRLGLDDRERAMRQRLARVQRRDPVHQFIQGLDYERLHDYPHAIKHYRRAIRLQRGEYRFYEALGRAYLLAGDARRASRALRLASKYSAAIGRGNDDTFPLRVDPLHRWPIR